MINLPLDIGSEVRLQIDLYRKNNNIPESEKIKKLYNKQDTFFEEELVYVTKLTVDGNIIDYIDYFPNLKSITFEGKNELTTEQMNEVIKKYPNLEELKVINQDKVQILNIENLKNLKDLTIVLNNNLRRINGLDSIKELYSVTFYGNEKYNKSAILELCDLVYKESYNGTECDIDTLYMEDFLNYLKSNNLSLDMVKDNVKWSEELKYGVSDDKLTYTTGELKTAYDKAKSVVEKYIKDTDTEEEKYAILYQLMCENVTYDDEALDNNRINNIDGMNRGRKNGTNGSVNGLVYGSCVCQGYTKAMQMLLKLAGIDSFDIHCIAEGLEEKSSYSLNSKKAFLPSDHSILGVNIDGKIYYSDVTWDAGRYQDDRERKYFLLSKEDISKNHKLLNQESVVNSTISISKEKQEELLDFAQTRINKIDNKKEVDIVEKEVPNSVKEIEKNIKKSQNNLSSILNQIEDLMKKNHQNPIFDYQVQLDNLIKKRDSLYREISILTRKKEKIHTSNIQNIERLLGIKLNAQESYKYDSNLKIQQIVLKNVTTLMSEKTDILQKLEQLYYEGKINLKNYSEMKIELIKEYEKMIATAPKTQEISKNNNVSRNDLFDEEKDSINHDFNESSYMKVEKSSEFDQMFKKRFDEEDINEESNYYESDNIEIKRIELERKKKELENLYKEQSVEESHRRVM